MTWVMRSSVFCSSPLDRLTIGIHGWIHFVAVSSVERTADVGTPTISSSAWRAASSRSAVAASLGLRRNPADSRRWCARVLTSSATSGSRAHSTVGLRAETSDATVVPQDPPPSTETCMGGR